MNRFFYRLLACVPAGVMCAACIYAAQSGMREPGRRFAYLARHDLLSVRVCEEENLNDAFDAVRPAVVQLHAGQHYGAGTVWRIAPEEIDILTNRHVADFFLRENGYVIFFNGETAPVDVVGTSEVHDVAMLRVRTADVTAQTLLSLRHAGFDPSALPAVKSGTRIFVIHSVIERSGMDDAGTASAEDTVSADTPSAAIAHEVRAGTVAIADAYIEALDRNMIYCRCDAEPGMSGGGTWDYYGRYIGMLTGGTFAHETVSLPPEQIMSALDEICGD